MAGTEKPSDNTEFTDAAGRPTDTAPGPRGARMAQLGILTKAQKKKPVLPNIRTNAEGKPNPNDEAAAKLSATLAEKAHDRLMQIKGNAQVNPMSETDPMQKSLIARTPMMRR